ncbi:hypothetical protein [Paenibacillus ehimensis]|uniref:50S ribosomal protein L33 n=1 Tax=Paenibacillus ehimensis TaxID=79264 RepID=A0ABT8VGX8_9BACL|nr:hypothetical protein [Paenibacillus ehimensis]MDO3680246.1 hypothetical protein [Paenibacillus ehimensis]MEC0207587.1 hypothetical protein [Paenibacillus ehimensis]
MPKAVRKQDVAKLVGKQIYAVKKDGTVVEGKLVRINGSQLLISPRKGKQVRTSAILPLVLFDLLAIGTAPYAYGGYGYGPYGYPFYGGGFFW